MKKAERSQKNVVRAVLVLAAMFVWASVPFFELEANAGDVPILIRTANLVSPSGSINPHGMAEFEVYANGHRELEVEIEDVNTLPAGTILTAFVNGAAIGQFALEADQRGRIKLRTQDGQTVPNVNDGNPVDVRNGSTVLVSGVFGGGGPGPNPTATPTGSPSPNPTGSPSPNPTGSPSPNPTGSPSPNPTGSPSPSPTGSPNESSIFAALSGGTLNGVLPTGFAEYGD